MKTESQVKFVSLHFGSFADFSSTTEVAGDSFKKCKQIIWKEVINTLNMRTSLYNLYTQGF